LRSGRSIASPKWRQAGAAVAKTSNRGSRPVEKAIDLARRHLRKIVDIHVGQVPKPRYIGLIQAQIGSYNSIESAMDATDDVHLSIVHPTIDERRNVILRDVSD
jgi:hypothetical protein